MASGLSPSINIGGIACSVLEDFGIVEGEQSGMPEATVRFKVAYSQRYALLKKLRGEVIYTPPTFSRTPGWTYPPSPNLICLDVPSIIPAPGARMKTDQTTGWPGYDYAAVIARFGVPPYPPGQYWSLRLDTTGEFLTLPNTTWRFVDGSATLVGSELARALPATQIQYTAHRLPFIPQAVIADLTGCVNDAAYTVGDVAYLRGTLLFNGGGTQIMASADGLEWDVTYVLIHKPQGWNTILHPTTYTWTPVTHNGLADGIPPYLYSDFTTIPV